MIRILITLFVLTCALIAQTADTAPRKLAPITFANLGTPDAGSVAYCSDCTKTNPCADGGTGALARREGTTWNCGGGTSTPGAGIQTFAATTSDNITYTTGATDVLGNASPTLVDGLVIAVRATAQNTTTAPKLAFNGDTARSIYQSDGTTAPSIGQLRAGTTLLQYSSTGTKYTIVGLPFASTTDAQGTLQNLAISPYTLNYVLTAWGLGMPTLGTHAYEFSRVNSTETGIEYTKKTGVPSTGVQNITGVSATVNADAGYITISPNGTYRLTSTPVIADGYDGQTISVKNLSATNYVLIPNDAVGNQSNIRNGGEDLVLFPDSVTDLVFDQAASVWVVRSRRPYRSIGFSFVSDSAVAAQTKCTAPTAYSGYLQGVRLYGDVTGSVTVQITSIAGSSYTNRAAVTTKIYSGSDPAISAATKFEDTTLTGYTRVIAKGTVVCAVIPSSATNITDLNISLEVATN